VRPSLGDLQACLDTYSDIVADIGSSDPTGDSLGCSGQILESKEEAEEELLDHDALLRACGSVFPVIWVHLRYDPQKVPRSHFTPFIEKYGLIPFTEATASYLPFLKGPPLE
jgi:hypothetical protein